MLLGNRRCGRIWTMFLAPGLVLALALVARWCLPILGERIVAGPSLLDGLDPDAIPAEQRFDGQPGELVAIIGPPGPHQGAEITGASFSADGKRFATVSGNGRIVIWDAAEMKALIVVAEETIPDSPLNLAMLAPDGQTLMVRYGSKVALWDLRNGQPQRPAKIFLLPGAPQGLEFTPDGKRIVCGRPGRIHLGDLDGNPIALADAAAEVKSVAATTDGKLVAVRTGERIRCYELAGDQLKERSVVQVPKFAAVVFAPGLQTFVGADESNTVRLFDITTGDELLKIEEAGPTVAFRADGKILATLTEAGTLRCVRLDGSGPSVGAGIALPIRPAGVSWAAFSPDLRSLVCASGGTVRLWDLEPCPRVRGLLQGRQRIASAVAFAPDGRTMAISGLFPRTTEEGDGADSVELWDLASRPPVLRTALAGHKKEVTALSFSPNGRVLVSASEDAVLLWDLVGGPPRRRATLEGAKAPAVFAPNGKRVATANRLRIQLWDLDGELVREWAKKLGPSRGPAAFGGRITALAFTPDGSMLATGTDTDTADLWSLIGRTNDKPEPLEDGEQGAGIELAISPDGKRLAAISNDGVLRLWKFANGKIQPRGIRDSIREGGAPPSMPGSTAVAFSPNNRYLAAVAATRRVMLWNAVSGNRLNAWLLPCEVHALAFAPDSRHLAIAAGNGTVYLLRLIQPPGSDPSRATQREIQLEAE